MAVDGRNQNDISGKTVNAYFLSLVCCYNTPVCSAEVPLYIARIMRVYKTCVARWGYIVNAIWVIFIADEQTFSFSSKYFLHADKVDRCTSRTNK